MHAAARHGSAAAGTSEEARSGANATIAFGRRSAFIASTVVRIVLASRLLSPESRASRTADASKTAMVASGAVTVSTTSKRYTLRSDLPNQFPDDGVSPRISRKSNPRMKYVKRVTSALSSGSSPASFIISLSSAESATSSSDVLNEVVYGLLG